MELSAVLERLRLSEKFVQWHASHPRTFLAHAFVMLDELNKDIWQIGFFDPGCNKMTTFMLGKETIEVVPDQDVLSTGTTVVRLDEKKVKLCVADALSKAEGVRQEHYKNEIPLKRFFIIQMHEGHPVYNVTCMTRSFKTVNVKVSAVDGGVIAHSVATLADFG